MTKKKINKDLIEVIKETDNSNIKVSEKFINISTKADTINVKFKLLNNGKIDPVIPKHAHDGDIGMDIVATDVHYDADNDYFVYHTGISMETVKNVACFLLARSSISNTEALLCNGVGLVDPFTYRGELCYRFRNNDSIESIVMHNTLFEWHCNMNWWQRLTHEFDQVYLKQWDKVLNNIMDYAPYNVGDRIGQMVFIRVPEVKSSTVKQLSKTERGEGGFGSTGK